MQPAHCLPDACVVGGGGLAGLPVSQYSDYVTVTSHHHQLPAPPEPLHSYATSHPVAGDFANSAMYVNTVWGEQPPAQHPQPPPGAGVYYESYPTYGGYPGHMLGGQDGSLPPGYPGMPGGSGGSMHSSDGEMHMSSHGKRKRRRVITYEQRKAANVRERKRMCHLNDAFDVLRKRVPTFAYEKKLSRIETLKLAVTYIQYMAELLEDIDDDTSKKGKKSRCSTGSSKSGGSAGEDDGMMTPQGSSLSPHSSTCSDSKENSPTGTLVTLVTMPANSPSSEHMLMDHSFEEQQRHPQTEGVIGGSGHQEEAQTLTVEVVTGSDAAASSAPEICSSQHPVPVITAITASPCGEFQPPSSGAACEDGPRVSPQPETLRDH